MGGCVTALAAWTSGPSALASRGPWGRRCRGTRGPARSRERPWGHRSVHRSAKTASRCRFGAFVYTVAPRAATRATSGGTSAPTTMACRRRPLGGHLPLGREDRLCVSGAIARLASSRDVNPHESPKSKNFPRLVRPCLNHRTVPREPFPLSLPSEQWTFSTLSYW